MAGKQYSVYRLTSPSGRSYVGYTGQPVEQRWSQHCRRSRTTYNHPLCQAIRKYGADNFIVEVLFRTSDLEKALQTEVQLIAETLRAYNISPGGERDIDAAHAAFREKLKDPAFRAEYGQRLSAAARASPQHRAHAATLAGRAREWREANPKAAYKHARRALRIGARDRAPAKTSPQPRGRTQSKENSSVVKKRRSIAGRRNATKQWAEMSPERKAQIHAKIAEGMKRHHASSSEKDKQKVQRQLAQARESIDHTLRKARQKEALIAYWTPERRLAFGAKVKTRIAAKKVKQ